MLFYVYQPLKKAEKLYICFTYLECEKTNFPSLDNNDINLCLKVFPLFENVPLIHN